MIYPVLSDNSFIAYLQDLFALHPGLKQRLEKLIPGSFVDLKEGKAFMKTMRKVLICNHLFLNNELSGDERDLVWSLVESGNFKGAERFLKDDDPGVISNVVRNLSKYKNILTTGYGSSQYEGPVKEASEAAGKTKPAEFFDEVDDIRKRWPLLEAGIREAFNVANAHFAARIAAELQKIPHKLIFDQTRSCKDALERELGISLNNERERSRFQLLADLENEHPVDNGR